MQLATRARCVGVPLAQPQRGSSGQAKVGCCPRPATTTTAARQSRAVVAVATSRRGQAQRVNFKAGNELMSPAPLVVRQQQQQAKPPAAADAAAAPRRPRVVVLGSGWAAASFVKALPKDIAERFEVVLMSPRNFFLYTPLLPAVAVGSLEDRAIVEPVRNLTRGKAAFYEAAATDVDVERREIAACFPKDAALGDAACFKVPYDVLVVGVGAVANTFGVPGAREHCLFFKTIEDAHALRARICECFERASLPVTSEEERRRLLNFVVVGGGPTGVEVAAEIHDLVHDNLSKTYPELVGDVRVRIVEQQDRVLGTYDRRISDFAARQFAHEGVELLLSARVTRVSRGAVTIAAADGNGDGGVESELPFGACVWATGIGMHPLVKRLQEQAAPGTQAHPRCLLTDDRLRVKGLGGGSVFAFGDAAAIDQPRAAPHSDALFDGALPPPVATDGEGGKGAAAPPPPVLSLAQLQQALEHAAGRFPHLAEHARFLRQTATAPLGLAHRLLAGSSKAMWRGVGGGRGSGGGVTRERFRALLEQVDATGLRAALPPTAQVAKQEGEFVAALLAASSVAGGSGDAAAGEEEEAGRPALVLNPKQRGFSYFHKGSLAYVGDDLAVADVPVVGALAGFEVGLLWRGYETLAQISLRNQLMVFNSWINAKVFGRDMSDV